MDPIHQSSRLAKGRMNLVESQVVAAAAAHAE
jgi:hypothetical protein